MAESTKRTARRDHRFLETLADSGNVSQSARVAGYSRWAVYKWYREDSAFAAAWRDALDSALDALEAEARRRALEGVQEGVFYQGTRIATVTKYSDSLLMFLLKAHRPEKYKDRPAGEVAPSDGKAGNVTIYVPDNGRDDGTC